MRERGQEFVFTAIGLIDSFVGALALGDIEEDRGDPTGLRTIGADLKPAVERAEPRVKMRRNSGAGDLSEALEPEWLGVREQLECGAPQDVGALEPGVPFKRRVDLEITQIAPAA